MNRGLFLLVACFSTPVFAMDLLDVYRLARENDPLTAAARAHYRAMQERVPQAQAGMLPGADVGLKRVQRGGKRRYDSPRAKARYYLPPTLGLRQDLHDSGSFATTGRLPPDY